MSLYNLHYLEFMATSHDKFWSHPGATFSLTIRPDFGSVLSGNGLHGGHFFSHKGHYHEAVAFSPKR